MGLRHMKASLQKGIQKIKQTQHVQKSVGLSLGQLAFIDGYPLGNHDKF